MRFKELLLENWSLKLTAIFLSLILWLMVRGDPNAERVIGVPLEVRVPRNMEITSERPSSVDVTVRGAFGNMLFAPSLPTYLIDMQAYEEGEHIVQLSPANVRFPRASGLEAIAVRPVRLKLTLEKTIAREVPIRLTTRGDINPGIDIYGVSVTPSTVVLSGPRSSVEQIKEVSTETISLAGQRQSIRAFVNLDIGNYAVHGTPAGPVEVNVILGPHRKMQRVTGIPVLPDEKSVTVVPQSVSLLVLVPTSLEKTLKAADFSASVLASSMAATQSVARLKPEVHLKNELDPAIVIKAIQPPEVTVRRNK